MSAPMLHETIWFDKRKYDEAEELYQAQLNGITNCPCPDTKTTKPDAKSPSVSPDKQTTVTQASCSSSIKEIAEARRKIQQTLSAAPASSSPSVHTGTDKRISELEEENQDLRKKMKELTAALKKLELRVTHIESSDFVASPAPVVQEEKKETKKDDDDDSDSDVDLFGSSSEDEESEESKRVKEERIAAYEAKKSKKPAVKAKSSILLDVKPWSDETDLVALEKKIRGIEADGLLWGVSKFKPIAYGVSKIQIGCVVEDDKVGSEFLEEEITGRFVDDVQSVDIAAFNKI